MKRIYEGIKLNFDTEVKKYDNGNKITRIKISNRGETILQFGEEQKDLWDYKNQLYIQTFGEWEHADLFHGLRAITEYWENGYVGEYNYLEEIKRDIKNYLIENKINLLEYDTRDELEQKLYDDLFDENSVTGNEYYYDSEFDCERMLCGNYDLALEACKDFCVDFSILIEKFKKHELAQYLDAIIRCYYLGEALNEILDELWKP